jgi:type IV pilus assembly protein PilA
MRHSPRQWHFPISFLLISASLVLLATACSAQTVSSKPADVPGLENLNKYPGLLPEFGRAIDKLQHNVTFPPERRHSSLLRLLPESTVAYMAIPNYGDTARQALSILRQELQASPELHAWWNRGEMLTVGPQVEATLDKLASVSEYLGDETVVSCVLNGRNPELLIVAQVRKPGLKPVLQNAVLALPRKSKLGVRVLDLRELATLKEVNTQELLVVVRPDFVIASTNLATLRTFDLQLDHGTRDFISNPFAQRILQSYASGVSLIGAVDLQRIVTLIPDDRSFAEFQRSGFADVKYAVWEHRTVNGRSVSETELSFTEPRHGIASWLGAPTHLGSFDFVSPKAILAASLVLNNPPQIFDDIKQLSSSNPNALASLTQMEQALGISLKDDILGQLGGEMTLEVDSITPGESPAWRAILRVKDAHRLQQTLGVLLNAAHFATEPRNENGVSYNLVRIPSRQGTESIGFAFVDGYLIFASSPDTLTEAIRLHRSGESLEESERFRAALPPGHVVASALIYQDPTAVMATRIQHSLPSLAESMSTMAVKTTPAVICVYGEESAIREVSTSPTVDASVVLIGAAVAIPNLLRSRAAANEAAAVATMRTMSTAQIAYYATYPDRGFAPDLTSLGPDPTGTAKPSADHADLLDAKLVNQTCTSGNWCTSSGYRFTIKASCAFGMCRDFVAVATPIGAGTGNRSFCSTSDGIIRYQIDSPLIAPPAPKECKAWRPLQ